MEEAERIARDEHGTTRLAVIAGLLLTLPPEPAISRLATLVLMYSHLLAASPRSSPPSSSLPPLPS